MNDQQEAGIPTLVSIYTDKWSGDVSADADYSETDSERDSDAEDFDGSSEEWEGDSDSEMATEEDEEVETDSEEGQDIELTEDQLNMLQKHVSEFQAANLPCRFTIVRDCVTYIQSGWQSEATFNRMKVQMLVCWYLYNKGRRSKKKSTLNLGRKWTYRDIVMDVYHKELHTMALSMSDSKAGSAEYLGCYQKALKTVLGGLTEEVISKYKAQAKRWTEDRLSPRQQHRMMEKHSKSMFWQFAQYVYDQFGMQIAIFTTYRDAKGDPAITLCISASIHAPTHLMLRDLVLTSMISLGHLPLNPAMKTGPVNQCFWTSLNELASASPNDSDEETPKRSKDAPPEIKLKTDTQGYPMLGVYQGCQAQIQEANQTAYLYFQSWPQVVVTGEFSGHSYVKHKYHHIRLGDANALLQHWTTRQAAGQIPFRFKDVAKTSQHSEPALRCGRVSANISHGNREEDPDGIQGAQEQGSEHDNNFQGGDKHSDNNDAQGGGNAANDLGPSMHSLPHNCLTPGHSGRSGHNRGAKGHVELPTEDGTDPAPPLINQPHSPNNGSQLDIAAEERSSKTQSVLRAAFGGHVTFSRIGTEMRAEGRKRQKMPEDHEV
ncbi:hypothetical protein EI94DRAFT_1803004 [Lactarius quietus]|nr:hypothetical protein EI94DRAFT_1803004 [Lactarius quietus]